MQAKQIRIGVPLQVVPCLRLAIYRLQFNRASCNKRVKQRYLSCLYCRAIFLNVEDANGTFDNTQLKRNWVYLDQVVTFVEVIQGHVDGVRRRSETA